MIFNEITHRSAIVYFVICLAFLVSCAEGKKESSGKDSASQIEPENPKSISTIAFGSCSHETDEQIMWAPILKNRPDVWIWLGDNVYGDTQDMALLKAKYDRQKSNPEYQKLIGEAKIVGIWDDHDYGANDAGKEYPMKKESRDLMFDFLDVPENHPAWKREGGYTSWEFGEGKRKVKVILLDARYFRDPLKKAPKESEYRYIPQEEGDFLGEEQWEWLKNELENSDAAVHIIGSGIQFIPEEHGWEKWANFRTARQRFFDLLKKTRANVPILLSGDRHIAEFSQLDIGLPHPVFEITASGLTHTWSQAENEPNEHRVGELIIQKNFGLMQIDWDKDPLEIAVQIKGEQDTLYQKRILKY